MFGGVTEHIEDASDPEYVSRLMVYNLHMAQLEFGLIAQSVSIVDPDWRADPRIEEMNSIGMNADTEQSYLRYIALTEIEDLIGVMREVQYLSTVTDRGMHEAMLAFGIEWQGVPLQKHKSPSGKLRASIYYQSRVAASSLGYTWEVFSELSGPMQSAVLAQHQCGLKIEYLASEERRT